MKRYTAFFLAAVMALPNAHALSISRANSVPAPAAKTASSAPIVSYKVTSQPVKAPAGAPAKSTGLSTNQKVALGVAAGAVGGALIANAMAPKQAPVAAQAPVVAAQAPAPAPATTVVHHEYHHEYSPAPAPQVVFVPQPAPAQEVVQTTQQPQAVTGFAAQPTKEESHGFFFTRLVFGMMKVGFDLLIAVVLFAAIAIPALFFWRNRKKIQKIAEEGSDKAFHAAETKLGLAATKESCDGKCGAACGSEASCDDRVSDKLVAMPFATVTSAAQNAIKHDKMLEQNNPPRAPGIENVKEGIFRSVQAAFVQNDYKTLARLVSGEVLTTLGLDQANKTYDAGAVSTVVLKDASILWRDNDDVHVQVMYRYSDTDTTQNREVDYEDIWTLSFLSDGKDAFWQVTAMKTLN